MSAHVSPTARDPTGVLVAILLAAGTISLAQTLVLPALPAIAEEMDTSPSTGSWVLTGFLLSASIATPIVGKLGDIYGRGRVLAVIMAVFSVGAIIDILAESIGVLIAGRTVQGIGFGVFPLAFGAVRDTFPPHRVAFGIGLISALLGIGAAIGMPLSGIIVDNLDVDWLFWINLTAVPAALAALRLVPSRRGERTRIDWLGAGLLSVALAAVLLGVSQAGRWGWDSPATVGLLAAGLGITVLWTRVETRVPEPFIDLRLLRMRAIAATNLAAFTVGLSMFAAYVLVPQFAQAPPSSGYGFGASVTVGGLLILPAGITQLALGPYTGRLGQRFGHRTVLVGGAAMLCLCYVLMALWHDSELELMIAMAVIGAGLSMALGSMANLIVAVAPQADVGVATGLNTVMRSTGAAFGVAITTAILTGTETAGLPTEGGYQGAFAFSFAAGLLAVGAALLVPRRRQRAATTGSRPAAATSSASAASTSSPNASRSGIAS